MSTSNTRPLEGRGRGRRPAGALIPLALGLGLLVACSPVAPALSTPEPSPASETAPATGMAYPPVGEPASATAAAYPPAAENAPADALAWAQAQVGSGAVVLVDDWKAANDSGDPESAVSENVATNANTMGLRPSTLARPQQPWSVDMAYGITSPEPNDYVGFDRDLPRAQDWSRADHMLVDVDGRQAADVTMVVQFWEASGEVWRHSARLSSLPAGEPLRVPLNSQYFERAPWSTRANDAIDLDAVNSYGVYVGHTGPGRAGVVTLGAIAVYQGTPPTP